MAEVARVLTPGGRAIITSANEAAILPLPVLHRFLDSRGRAEEAPDPPETLRSHAHGANGADGPWRRDGASGLRVRELESLVHDAGLQPEARGACCRIFTELLDHATWLPSGLRRLLAALDHLTPAASGYEVAVAARKPLFPSKEQ